MFAVMAILSRWTYDRLRAKMEDVAVFMKLLQSAFHDHILPNAHTAVLVNRLGYTHRAHQYFL